MKVKYVGNDIDKFTPGVTYLAFEISHYSNINKTYFRVVDNMGIPALYDINDFEFRTLDLNHLIYWKNPFGYTCTLKNIFDLGEETRRINNAWGRYFDGEEEIIEIVNEIIIEYAKSEQTVIPYPHPYGGKTYIREASLLYANKEGAINKLIYDQISYNEGRNKKFLHINELFLLIKKIKELNVTTEYINIIPFYRNEKFNVQIEYDQYMFFLLCIDDVSDEEKEKHWAESIADLFYISNTVKQYRDLSKDSQKMARVLFPLCRNDDVISFQKYLDDYKVYLDELIPIMFKDAIKRLELTRDDIASGYFCFEVLNK